MPDKTGWDKFLRVASIGGAFCFFLGIILSAIYTLPNFVNSVIDARINKVVQGDDYVRRIAKEARPSVIFDSHGSILANQGAMEYFDNIDVITNKPAGLLPAFPEKIIVKPKQFLAQAPLLTLVDSGSEMDVKVERGEKFDGVYTVVDSEGLGRGYYRFRLEVLP